MQAEGLASPWLARLSLREKKYAKTKLALLDAAERIGEKPSPRSASKSCANRPR
ncbi:MAG TPA: hypothetical protein VI197_08585 [Polyangiaceae bacterium]